MLMLYYVCLQKFNYEPLYDTNDFIQRPNESLYPYLRTCYDILCMLTEVQLQTRLYDISTVLYRGPTKAFIYIYAYIRTRNKHKGLMS